jgi:hypothetical protein
MEEQVILAEFKLIADTRKKNDGMVSRQAIVESLELLCVNRCKKLKNSNPTLFTDAKLVNEVNLVCRTMQKMFQYPDDLITQLILPNVRVKIRNM